MKESLAVPHRLLLQRVRSGFFVLGTVLWSSQAAAVVTLHNEPLGARLGVVGGMLLVWTWWLVSWYRRQTFRTRQV